MSVQNKITVILVKYNGREYIPTKFVDNFDQARTYLESQGYSFVGPCRYEKVEGGGITYTATYWNVERETGL